MFLNYNFGTCRFIFEGSVFVTCCPVNALGHLLTLFGHKSPRSCGLQWKTGEGPSHSRSGGVAQLPEGPNHRYAMWGEGSAPEAALTYVNSMCLSRCLPGSLSCFVQGTQNLQADGSQERSQMVCGSYFGVQLPIAWEQLHSIRCHWMAVFIGSFTKTVCVSISSLSISYAVTLCSRYFHWPLEFLLYYVNIFIARPCWRVY